MTNHAPAGQHILDRRPREGSRHWGGFPVVLTLSWMYDVNTKGIQRTESEVSGASLTKLRVLQVLGLVLSLLLAGLVSWWVLGG